MILNSLIFENLRTENQSNVSCTHGFVLTSIMVYPMEHLGATNGV